jgi:hypothetical protein
MLGPISLDSERGAAAAVCRIDRGFGFGCETAFCELAVIEWDAGIPRACGPARRH